MLTINKLQTMYLLNKIKSVIFLQLVVKIGKLSNQTSLSVKH